MKNKELNLCEILKGKEGTKIYCTLFGYGTIVEIFDNGITVQNEFGTTLPFYSDGRFSDGDGDYDNGECLLFPSKNNRDWSTFKPNVERFDSKTLKPFDKVLVRDYDEDNWRIDIFSDICNGMRKDSMRCIDRTWYQCIPYNDDTKHLVGTTDKALEYYKYWEN